MATENEIIKKACGGGVFNKQHLQRGLYNSNAINA